MIDFTKLPQMQTQPTTPQIGLPPLPPGQQPPGWQPPPWMYPPGQQPPGWQPPPPGYDPYKDPNFLGELPPPGYYDDQGNRQFPPIGLPPLPPGYQIPGQPPIGLPPLPPPGYQGDNVSIQVPGQFGQPMEGNRTMGTQPRNPMEGVMQGGRPTPIPRMSMGTIGGGFNQLPMQPVTQPIQQVSPLQQMGNPFGQGGGMQKTTPQKRIPKGSMYGGMERL